MKVKLLHPKAIAPTKAYSTDAGYDLYCTTSFSLTERKSTNWATWPPTLINTGIAIEIPDGKFGLLKERSSLAARGMKISGGVVDYGYTGEIIIIADNLGAHPIRFYEGDKIAQLIIMPIYISEIQVVEELHQSKRGDKGFGSSGD